LAGKISNFTGINSPYEAPEAPDIHVAGAQETLEAAVMRIVDWLLAHRTRRV